jgi:uncharacterized protein (TIGR03067 family)
VKPETDSDHAALQGRWAIVKAELAGEAMPGLVAEKTEVELSAGNYVVRFDGQTADRGRYVLGTAGLHRGLTLVGLEGPNVGRTIPAIYQLVGDRLRVCYGIDGQTPGGFATASGSRLYLVTYRRKLPTG